MANASGALMKFIIIASVTASVFGEEYCCAHETNICFEREKVCDGIVDCQDGDDEFYCDLSDRSKCLDMGKVECPGNATTCMLNHDVCDGTRFCLLEEDEFDCEDWNSCPGNCGECWALRLVCRNFQGWSDEDLLNIKPNVKLVIFSGNNKPVNATVWTIKDTMGDDLAFQKLKNIHMGSFVNAGITRVNAEDTRPFKHLRMLNIMDNPIQTIPNGTFTHLEELKHLYVWHCNVSVIGPGAFPSSLIQLFLNGNALTELMAGMFAGLNSLDVLLLSDQSIERIESGTFADLSKLSYLDLESNSISVLMSSSFVGLDGLEWLHLKYNDITTLAAMTFSSMPKLHYIDLSANPLVRIEGRAFSGIYKLTKLIMAETGLIQYDKDIAIGLEDIEKITTQSYGLCCLINTTAECNTPPSPFATCYGIFRNLTLRICAWIVIVSALVGNTFVIVWRILAKRIWFKNTRRQTPQDVLIINLAFADLLMGVYLAIVAISDLVYSSDYFLYSKSWRSSTMCFIAGILGTMSGEVSVFILCTITFDRFLSLVYPFSRVRFSPKSARNTCLVLWLLAFGLSLIPTILSNYIEGFYGFSDVCLGLPLVTEARDITGSWREDNSEGYVYVYSSSGDRSRWVYSICLFIVLNAVCFLYIAISYAWMFIAIRKSAQAAARGANMSNEVKMAFRMGIIVGTDFLCWAPIIIMGILSQAGLPIPVSAYAWIVIFVLPINSALNPYLFTISSIGVYRRKMSESMASTKTQMMVKSNTSPKTSSA